MSTILIKVHYGINVRRFSRRFLGDRENYIKKCKQCNEI
jgi:hypothetical protein